MCPGLADWLGGGLSWDAHLCSGWPHLSLGRLGTTAQLEPQCTAPFKPLLMSRQSKQATWLRSESKDGEIDSLLMRGDAITLQGGMHPGWEGGYYTWKERGVEGGSP